MKKKILIFFIPVILLVCLGLFYAFKQVNQIHIKRLTDINFNLDKDKYPFLNSLYSHKINYKKKFYHMQPELEGIDNRSISESWSFNYNGNIYYAFQNNEFWKLKKEDEDLSKTHYYLSIYDSNKKLISEMVEDSGKYEKLTYTVFRNNNKLNATIVVINPKTLKINKKIYKILEIQNAEYISGISDYLEIVPYDKVLGLKNKTYCIFSENSLKLNNYNYKIIQKKAKTKEEPWNIEFEEIEENSHEPINSKYFFDSEKDVVYKSSYGNISTVLTDYNEFYCKCAQKDNEAVNISIPLNFWLINRNDLEEIKLKITFNNKGFDSLIKKTSRQQIKRIDDKTIILTLLPEKFTYTSTEKITKKDISDALESNLNYPSSDLRIQALAHSITKNVKDNLEKSFLIMNWIDENIKWTYDSNTEVLQTIDTKKGDCSERSALFITLARASGIPATFSAGYAIDVDALGGHAWVKIHENNRWIELDPSNPGFITTDYLTTDPSLLPKDFKDIQVLELKYKDGTVKKIHRNKPFIEHKKRFYSNRILGLAFKLPNYAKLDIPKKLDCGLFKVSMVQSIFNLKNLVKNSGIIDTQNFVLISDYDKNLFKEESKIAINARFNGVSMGDKRIIEENGHKLLVEKIVVPKTNKGGIIYHYPLKKDFIIDFLVVGGNDDINTLFLKNEIPPLFADILKGTKRINQDY